MPLSRADPPLRARLLGLLLVLGAVLAYLVAPAVGIWLGTVWTREPAPEFVQDALTAARRQRDAKADSLRWALAENDTLRLAIAAMAADTVRLHQLIRETQRQRDAAMGRQP